MKRIGVLVYGSLQESMRDKVILTMLAIGSLLLFCVALTAPMTLGAREKTFHDMGLAWIHLSGLLVLLVLGTWILHRERERGIWLTILTRPVDRKEYLLGRFLGLLATLAATLAATGAIYSLIAVSTGIQPLPGLGYALLFTFLEMSILAGLLLLFSTVTGFTLSVLLALALYFAGHLSSDLLRIAELTDSLPLKWTTLGIHWLLPHLEIFRIRDDLVAGIVPTGKALLQCVLYAVLYIGALFGVSYGVFSRREIR